MKSLHCVDKISSLLPNETILMHVGASATNILTPTDYETVAIELNKQKMFLAYDILLNEKPNEICGVVPSQEEKSKAALKRIREHVFESFHCTESQFMAAQKQYNLSSDVGHLNFVDNPRCSTIRMKSTNSTIHLVGTCHCSDRSKQDVREVIRHTQPHNVCVEMCLSRYPSFLATMMGKEKEEEELLPSWEKALSLFKEKIAVLLQELNLKWWHCLPAFLVAAPYIPSFLRNILCPCLELVYLDTMEADFRRKGSENQEGGEFLVAALQPSGRRGKSNTAEIAVPMGLGGEYLIDRDFKVLLNRVGTEILKTVNEDGLYWSALFLTLGNYDYRVYRFISHWEKNKLEDISTSSVVWKDLILKSNSGASIDILQQGLKLYRSTLSSNMDVSADKGPVLAALINATGAEFPLLKIIGKSFIEDRNDHMTEQIRKICEARPNQTIVAVVGALHVPGMVSNLDKINQGVMPAYVCDTSPEWTEQFSLLLDSNPRLKSFLEATEKNTNEDEKNIFTEQPLELMEYGLIGAGALAAVTPHVGFGFGLRAIKHRFSPGAAVATGICAAAAYVGNIAWEVMSFSNVWNGSYRLQQVALEMDDPVRAQKRREEHEISSRSLLEEKNAT
jgi:pheromone shutdown protein TraB